MKEILRKAAEDWELPSLQLYIYRRYRIHDLYFTLVVMLTPSPSFTNSFPLSLPNLPIAQLNSSVMDHPSYIVYRTVLLPKRKR